MQRGKMVRNCGREGERGPIVRFAGEFAHGVWTSPSCQLSAALGSPHLRFSIDHTPSYLNLKAAIERSSVRGMNRATLVSEIPATPG